MGKAKRYNDYDGAVASERAISQTYGEARQKLSIGSSFRSLPLSPPIASPSSTGGSTVDNLTVPIALIKMDDDVLDSIGSNDGTVTGTTSFVPGVIGSAFDFNGSSRINLANESNFDFENTDSFSLSCWFKTSGSTNQILIAKMLNTTPFPGWDIFVSITGAIGFQLIHHAFVTDELINALTTTTGFNDGEWHFVTSTYNGNKSVTGVRIFVDGVEQTVTASSVQDELSLSMLNNETVSIGARAAGGLEFTGNIDDVRIYDQVLSANEIITNYVNSVTLGSSVGAAASFPLAYSVDDQGNKSGTVTHSLTASTAHKLQFTATGDCNITITGFGSSNANAVDFYIEVTQDGTGGHAITVNDSEWIDFPTISTTADTTSLIAAHADGDGNMRAVTLLNAAGSSLNFASKQLDDLSATSLNTDIHMNTFDIDQLDRLVFDESAGTSLAAGDVGITSDASSNLNHNVAVTGSHIFTAASVEIAKIEEITAGVYQLDMLAHKIKDSREHIFDNSTEAVITGTNAVIGYSPTTEGAMLYNVPATKKHIFKVNDVDQMTLDDGNLVFRDGLQVIFNPDTTNPGVNIGLVVGDPSATNNGDLWYNSSTDKFRTKENGSNVDVIGGAGLQTPWVADIDADGFDLKDLSNIEFRSTTGAPGGSVPNIHVDGSGDMVNNVATGDTHFWKVNNVTEMQMSSVALLLTGIDLDMENNLITDADQIQITGPSGDTIRGFFTGQTGILEITSNENSSSVAIATRNSGGTLVDQLIISDDILDSRAPLVFGSNDPLTGSQHGICQDSNGTRINAPTGDVIALSINNNARLSMADTAWGGQTGEDFRLFCVTSGNKAPINLEPAAGDPTTTSDGDIWYNSTSHKYKGKENGSIVTFTTT